MATCKGPSPTLPFSQFTTPYLSLVQLPNMALAWIYISTVGCYSNNTFYMATSEILPTFTKKINTMVTHIYFIHHSKEHINTLLQLTNKRNQNR